MNIRESIQKLLQEIPSGVRVVAVSKTKPDSLIREAYNAGQRLFGENRTREITEKYPALPHDIEWHYIGHLQTNKVKQIAPFIGMIQSVDSLHLLTEIDKEAGKNGRVIPCLLQFHIASEETKSGLNRGEAESLLSSATYGSLRNIHIAGVMGMATFTDDTGLVRKEFKNLYGIYSYFKSAFFNADPGFCEVSMGMSGDYRIAIEEGSTMIRIGTAIFGER